MAIKKFSDGIINPSVNIWKYKSYFAWVQLKSIGKLFDDKWYLHREKILFHVSNFRPWNREIK